MTKKNIYVDSFEVILMFYDRKQIQNIIVELLSLEPIKYIFQN